MKLNRIYRMFFNNMLSESIRAQRYDIDKDFIALTDGWRVYKILRRDCPLNLDKMNNYGKNDKLPKFELTDKHKKLERTNELVDLDMYNGYNGKSKYARKYHCNDFDVWVNDSFIEFFENPTFYGTDKDNYIVICEGNTEPIGIVMIVKDIHKKENE